jgi:pyruvate,water dikinase
VDTEEETLVPTFEGLVSTTPFLKQVRGMLAILQEQLRTPVDIEFAHDGTDLYLLQCRPQSFTDDALPSPIPKEVPSSDVVFSANRHVSNGWVPDITHIVYVDPLRYTELSSRNEMLAVGRAIGKLNKILPKRQFILMGPGRWGSRGDIKLGVSVTYADISNTAVLIEVARKQGNYLPDVSFGTHFFQDLVESHIRYLPLYPDDDGIAFNETFLRGAPNLLPRILPECRDLAEVIRVIDVPAVAEGRVLRVLLNADLDEALGLIVSPDLEAPTRPVEASGPLGAKVDYTRWRLKMTEQLARELDPERFGVAALYVFGSVKNNTAGPASDIDLLVHVRGTEAERRDLETWLEGWSLCLAEMNYLRTGYRSEGLLDVHIVTDEDIRNRSSFAAKIDAVTDAARPLPMGGQGEKRGG